MTDRIIQPRRDFLKQAGGLAVATTCLPIAGMDFASAALAKKKTPETLVSLLYESLNEIQRKAV